MGGSPSRPVAAHARSTTAPAPDASARGTERVGSGTPAARQIRASSSATVRGSPLVTTKASPLTSLNAVKGSHEGVGSVVDVGRVDQRGTTVDQHEPPGRRTLDDAAHQLGVARAPDQVWAHCHRRE